MPSEKVISTLIASVTGLFIILINLSVAHAEPIQIAGLSHKLSKDEQLKFLNEQGFKCEESINPFASEAELWNGGLLAVSCEKENKKISIKPNKITFACSTFNICKFSFKEVAQLIVDEGIVQTLEHDVRRGKNLDGKRMQWQTYCGRGDSGDLLCVEERKDPIFSRKYVEITLARGALGENGEKVSVSFN